MVYYNIKPKMSVEQFDELCQKFSAKTEDASVSSHNRISIHVAAAALNSSIQVNNYVLAQYLIKTFGKEVIDLQTPGGKTNLCTAIHDKNIRIIELLINSGANINNFSPYNKNAAETKSISPLATAIKKGQAKVIQLLLNNGAQGSISFSENGCKILKEATLKGKNCTVLVEKQHSIEEEINEKSMNFLLEKFKSDRFYQSLNNEIREKALKMIDDAAKIICQNETLFLCAVKNISEYSLPDNIIKLILRIRIILDIKNSPYKFTENKLPRLFIT